MIDVTDRKLLNMLQYHFPLSATPFADVGEKLGLSETEVIARLKKLKQEGLIRRLGAIFDSRKLGYVSTLVAAKIPEDKIDEAVAIINRLAGVTHNYLRNHDFNVWFTITAHSEARLTELLETIRQRTGIDEMVNLPAKKTFKIRVEFKMTEHGCEIL